MRFSQTILFLFLLLGQALGQAEKLAWSSLVRSMLSSNEFLHIE